MPDEQQIWENLDEYGDPSPPITVEQLREWEDRHGVRLPVKLTEMLMIQNGGCVSGTEGLLWIEPLERFESLALPQWKHVFRHEDYNDHQFGDPGQIFYIGHLDAAHLVLDYNVGEEPRLLRIDEDEMHAWEFDTFDELIENVLDSED
jgi:hypothetical protein